MRVGAEDWELGQSVGLSAASCWQGGIVWDKILRLLCPGGGPPSSPLDSFGEVDIPGGTTGYDTREEV
jgi:hypothetical protein